MRGAGPLGSRESFTSPLRLAAHDAFTVIGFGQVEPVPEIDALRRRLSACVLSAADGLPTALAGEARALLRAYSGGDGDLMRLFYVPVWSFLHWVPAAGGHAGAGHAVEGPAGTGPAGVGPSGGDHVAAGRTGHAVEGHAGAGHAGAGPAGAGHPGAGHAGAGPAGAGHAIEGHALAPEMVAQAREAQALALFLHLWDDHLCDGQLPTDLLRLHLRTVAWQRFAAACRGLCAAAGADPGLVDLHVAAYLESVHRPEAAADLDAYLHRFRRQAAIWTLVPRMLGWAAGGAPAAAALARIVEDFAVAWRLMDDIQDIRADSREGRETAVWLALDADGRRCWRACRAGRGDGAPGAGEAGAGAGSGTGEAGTWAWTGQAATGARERGAPAGETGAWAYLVAAVRAPGCLDRLLALVVEHLAGAARAASLRGWPGIAAELSQCGWGLPVGAGP